MAGELNLKTTEIGQKSQGYNIDLFPCLGFLEIFATIQVYRCPIVKKWGMYIKETHQRSDPKSKLGVSMAPQNGK